MLYSINQIKKAGKTLINEQNNEMALKILSYWRSEHEKPLRESSNFIEKYLKKHFKYDYILAHRLKRTPSIIKKLKRFHTNGMQLSTMQDIGGCRVILNDILSVNKIIKILTNSGKLETRNNYILIPKEDGYRSIHLTGIFSSRIIEIQVRTKIQHSWATAVEIVDLFTKQSIKHNKGEDVWKDFFKQSSIVLDYLEKCLLDNFNLLSKNKLKIDIKTQERLDKYFNKEIHNALNKVSDYAKSLEIIKQFKIFTSSLTETSNIINTHKVTNEYLLLHISKDTEKKYILECQIYSKNQYIIAEEKYINLEKETINSKTDTVALISTSKIEDIKDAYPNYFADSTIFSNLISLIVGIADDKKKKEEKELRIFNNQLPENFNSKYLDLFQTLDIKT
ncbi:RelA/SpoT domain-containing protein [Aliarcobacter butzleri]|uniref:RelA/SpoT domain-containing protein n=1 Tax=Aliarcobacter butzleri TaxID=28197 RepID=UPI001ED9F517|nr:RelA/SpoT domain-containing protein [Aliarcobacter butzleri]MCG3684450.1 RelA/SpoT domain-containing protein [Aliarcobacter butzleri]MCG3705616.1 RelA/SpoT domain-containing protein [Aliarcobacter butzleri]MCT7555593.1 RelA/SpoT domain-containing protein [Aliarcobacter butzleri]MCT7595072.1 RelA/SpoT domain-containing protein [Aliarcobacter butzleri]MCT7604827.1 RelA/SpoT domain-containing protein [Aliarcobacter butzleri]